MWWVLLMSFWVILDDSIALDELLAGAGAAALGGAVLAELAAPPGRDPVPDAARWVAPALRLPGRSARDTVIVFAPCGGGWPAAQEPASGFRELPVRLRAGHGRGP